MQRLNDDTLLLVSSLLPVASILSLRKAVPLRLRYRLLANQIAQTCTRLDTISRQHTVWQTACVDQVLRERYPFSHRDAATADAHTLERLVLRSLRIGKFWLSHSAKPHCALEYQASSGTGVSDVRFLSGHGDRYIATVYKGIWSMISCWDVGDLSAAQNGTQPRKVADWCPKGAIFSGFVVNTDPDSDAVLATAMQIGRSVSIRYFYNGC